MKKSPETLAFEARERNFLRPLKYQTPDNNWSDWFVMGYKTAYRWISVNDRLPDEHHQVLIKTHDDSLYVGIYSTEKEYGNWFNYTEADIDFCLELQDEMVTHWREIEHE